LNAELRRVRSRPNLSVIALVSFILSFIVARTFSTLNPTEISIFGFRIHHFWYGIILLAIGGWLGIVYDDPRIGRIAAILYGAGGGLIADEIGILLTLSSEGYWAAVTYTFVVIFVAILTILVTMNRYSRAIKQELSEFTRSSISIYSGIFLMAVSIALILETDNRLVIAVSIGLTVLGLAQITAYLAQRMRHRDKAYGTRTGSL
jgi:hypothetical protein